MPQPPLGYRQQLFGMTNPYRTEGAITRILIPYKDAERPYELLIDTDDLPRVLALPSRLYVKVHHTKSTTLVYAQFRHKRKTITFHRWLIDAPDDKEVDHSNWNGIDCRRSNLRLVTHAENLANRRFSTYQAHKLVREHKDGDRWAAWVFLGEFPTQQDADLVYDDAHTILEREGLWDVAYPEATAAESPDRSTEEADRATGIRDSRQVYRWRGNAA